VHRGIQIEDLATGLPNYQFVFQAAHTEFPYGFDKMYYTTKEGVAIFSKYPIIRTSHLRLSRNFSDLQDAHHRVCLGAVIRTPLGDISFFTTHFPLSAQARKRNIVELYEFVATYPQPAIIVGDFNTEPNTPEIQFLQGKIELAGFKPNFKDAFDHLVKRMNLDNDEEKLEIGWTYTTLTKEPKKRIDFIFYSPTLEVVDFECDDNYVNEKVIASDHRPILAVFTKV